MELVILVVVVILGVGALKGMNREDRSSLLKGAITGTKVAVVYTASQTKHVGKTTYDFGHGLGNQISNEYQEQTAGIGKWSDELEAKGVTKTIASIAKEHRDYVGITAAEEAAANYRKEQEARKAAEDAAFA